MFEVRTVFGKLYFLGAGAMLFVSGTAISLASDLIAGPCAKIASMETAFDIAFNPCSLFSSLPDVGFLMQVFGVIILGLAIFFIVRSARKGSLACPNCGEKVSKKSAFCSKCGAKLPAAETQK